METQQKPTTQIPPKEEENNTSSSDSNNSFTTIANNTTIMEETVKISTFKDKINDPKSIKVKENMLNFIREVQQKKQKQDSKLPDLVRNKISEIEDQFQTIWLEIPQIQKENGEVIEAVIIKALYNNLISLFDKRFDHKMHLNLKIYEFINLKHFDIDPQCVENQSFKKALQYISKIDTLKSPKDKLQSICYSCKHISQMLAQQNKQSPIGADQFLPILVYAVLKAEPQNPITNLEFIREFRMGHRLKGVEEYYFTAYQSALEFIEEIDETKLNITKENFQKQYKNQYNKYKDDFQIIQDKQINNFKVKQITKEECLENLFQLKTHIYDLHENFNTLERKDKLKFINKPYSQIQIGELQEFFNEYHLIAKHYIDMQQKVNNLTQVTDTLLENKQPKKQRFLGNWF